MENLKIKEDWKIKIKKYVIMVSMYYPELLKILFSTRTRIQLEERNKRKFFKRKQ